MCHIQENIIFCFIHAVFDEELFFKYIDSHLNEHKLYNKLLNKISSEIKLLMPGLSGKDRPAPVSIPHISIPPIQNNPLTCFSLLFFFYKSLSLLSISNFKKLTVEIEKNDNVDSDVEIQPLSPQQPLCQN